ncbi:hypothetical protein [Chryseobacterium sp. MA9]|uniref:hypothetical protein n=1 Tax=Chryseobacterium sp. MA9 TaxID=2966625 RepID=UPI00210615C0|nr:hypothetical protein [Chryseobacterium sp. MA9]UTX49108.1 hypothetical protein KIK00_02210 [Chryseobacterium sp. MA9]
MNEIFENFSCKSWLLIDKNKVDSFIKDFSLIKIEENEKWIDADGGDPSNTLIITGPVGDYVIVEGKLLENDGKKISEEFSAQHKTLLFNMTIDIWIPYMFYEVYREGKQIRRIEYDLDLEEGEVSSTESGEKQDFEDNVKYIPDSTVGYDDFFYPLYLMNSLHIKMSDIMEVMNKSSTLYSINR